jgi:hypothetical protein
MVLLFGFEVPEIVLVIIGLLWLAATIGGFLFSVAMFFDAFPKKFKGKIKRIIWLLFVLFFPFGSLVYYFLFKSKTSFLRRMLNFNPARYL